VDGWKEDVHERGAGESSVDEAEQRSEHDPAAILDGEDRVVAESEYRAEDEVKRVADDFPPDAVFCDGGAEQEWKVDARQAELARNAQRRGQDDRAVDTAA
jgi:hypothetical protein